MALYPSSSPSSAPWRAPGGGEAGRARRRRRGGAARLRRRRGGVAGRCGGEARRRSRAGAGEARRSAPAEEAASSSALEAPTPGVGDVSGRHRGPPQAHVAPPRRQATATPQSRALRRHHVPVAIRARALPVARRRLTWRGRSGRPCARRGPARLGGGPGRGLSPPVGRAGLDPVWAGPGRVGSVRPAWLDHARSL
ncbi:hypothetical protein PVAP13_9KG184585 [Panicum virgatum]|uniref:Uncharacterized protein n=1 Tax=Panicum virgatum TaxID=38727 RepID=A0A8T0NMP8_PANVG|nr:hypothetical protein PVAP13_9KG184585 [Panicum virgatum]